MTILQPRWLHALSFNDQFCTDVLKVHLLLKIFLLAESTEQWIHHLERHANGRLDKEALHLHYNREGNVSR